MPSVTDAEITVGIFLEVRCVDDDGFRCRGLHAPCHASGRRAGRLRFRTALFHDERDAAAVRRPCVVADIVGGVGQGVCFAAATIENHQLGRRGALRGLRYRTNSVRPG